MKNVRIYEHRCLRCGHRWVSRRARPIRCASCKSPYWHIPKGEIENPTCYFCGQEDVIVPEIGISFDMGGEDYAFCEKCLKDMTALDFWETMFRAKKFTWPPKLLGT